MIDDPFLCLAYGILLLAGGMYPVGFLFGACSDCCNVCRNDTCDGFDLEEAFGGERTVGRLQLCELTLQEDGTITFPWDRRAESTVSKGCRVFGEGIAANSVVTEVREIQSPAKQPYVLAPRGCCSFKWFSGGFKNSEKRVLTEEQCANLTPGFYPFGPPPFYPPGTVFGEKQWTYCDNCQGGFVGPATISGGRQSGASITALRITISPPPAGAIGECLSFCGANSICAISPPDESYVNDSIGVDVRRRNCLRWVCRCYEGTGKQYLRDNQTGELLFPNASDWYEVASTTVVGGPTTNDRDLNSDLTNASGLYDLAYAPTYEQEWLFDTLLWPAGDGDIKCLIWTFVFYGLSTEGSSNCETGKIGSPKNVEITDAYYSISWPCDRCQ